MDDHLTFNCNCSKSIMLAISFFIGLGENLPIIFRLCLMLFGIGVVLLLIDEGIVVFEEGLQMIRHREA